MWFNEVEMQLVGWGVPIFSRAVYKLAIQDCQITRLGKGGQGTAYLVCDNSAKWVMKKTSRSFLPYFLKEVYALVKTQKVVGVQRLAWVCLEESELIMATHYAGRTLHECLNRMMLSPAQGLGVVQQLSVTLAQMHQVGITHNDIKDDNICVNFVNGKVCVTLIDFGMAGAREAVTSARADVYNLSVIVSELEWHRVVTHKGVQAWARETDGQRATILTLLLAFNTRQEVGSLIKRRRDKRFKRFLKH